GHLIAPAAFPRQAVTNLAEQFRPVGMFPQMTAVQAENLLRTEPGDLIERGIRPQNVAVAVGDKNAFGNRLKYRSEQLPLAVQQRPTGNEIRNTECARDRTEFIKQQRKLDGG